MATTAFERVQMARHPERPYALDIIATIFTDFVEVHGDRRYADDPAMITGFARLDGTEVCVIGQQKGRGGPEGVGQVAQQGVDGGRGHGGQRAAGLPGGFKNRAEVHVRQGRG